MPHIQLNPALWTVSSTKPRDDVTLAHGETLDVSVDEWEELRLRTSRQFGNSYKTYVTVEAPEIEPVERLWVRAENLLELSKDELKAAAAERGLSTGGSKQELADRIVEYEEIVAADSADESA